MIIKEVLKRYHKIEIDLLLAHLLKVDKEFLFLFPEHRLTRIQTDRLTRMAKRREKGEPIAYILGYKDFYGLRFKVNRDVLVPRPETEMIVEKVVLACRGGQWPPKKGRPMAAPTLGTIKILDVGTGSGCIAISLAKQFQNQNFKFQITASDISTKALETAKQNAKAHRVKIKFIHSDILSRRLCRDSDFTSEKNVRMSFDVIVANLPYLSYEWKDESIKFEPKEALFAGEKGMYLIHRLLSQAAKRKIKPKLIFLEFDPRQKASLHRLIKKVLPKAEVKFHKDLNGFWRIAEIKSARV